MSGKPDFVCDLKNFEFTFQFCAIYFFNVFTFLIHAYYFSILDCHSEKLCICFSILCVIILHMFFIFIYAYYFSIRDCNTFGGNMIPYMCVYEFYFMNVVR